MELPNRPSMDEISTAADPGRASRNGGIRWRLMTAAARRLTLRVASHTASSMSSTVAAPETPAAWTNPPSDPSAAAAEGTAPATADESDTSTTSAWAATPSARQAAAVSSAPGPSTSQRATGRPTSARASAVARPIPEPPPVISTPVPGSPRRSDGRAVDGAASVVEVMAGVSQTPVGVEGPARPVGPGPPVPASGAQVRRPR